MESVAAAFAGAVGSVAFCAMCSLAIWVGYRKEKEQREFEHKEKMKALEMGIPLPDLESAKNDSRTVLAAALVGIVVPVVLVAGTLILAAIIIAHRVFVDDAAAAFGIGGVLLVCLITVFRSLGVIRQKRVGGGPSNRTPVAGRRNGRGEIGSGAIQEKSLEL